MNREPSPKGRTDTTRPDISGGVWEGLTQLISALPRPDPDEPNPMRHEYVGVVEEMGDDVRSVQVGRFVIGSFFSSKDAPLQT
jgi:NADPH:quinone reductase-like Zn-dependent oxidoreductase